MIKEARWSGWVWVGECFFWYRPTQVVPDQRPLNGRCCCCCTSNNRRKKTKGASTSKVLTRKWLSKQRWHTHTATHTRLMAFCQGLPGWAGTRKVKPVWILLKQETVSGSGISWAVYKSASRSRQTCQHPTTKFLKGRMPFQLPNQQRQSTEGTKQRWQWHTFLFKVKKV